MPEIRLIYLYDAEFNKTSYISKPIYISKVFSYSFSVYCSVDCIMTIRNFMDIEHLNIVSTILQNITGR